MSRTFFILFTLLALLPSLALAQPVNSPRWDAAVTTGLFTANPNVSDDSAYRDDWYGEARGAVSVGRYWTAHLKTELEVAASGEGSLYVQRLAAVPGSSTRLPYYAQEYSRFAQGSARVVWQFLENQWVHPYVMGGISLDAERRRAFTPEQVHYTGDYRLPESRVLLVPAGNEGPRTSHRAAVVGGFGAKLYVSPRAFANTSVLITHAKPATTVAFILGMGLDF